MTLATALRLSALLIPGVLLHGCAPSPGADEQPERSQSESRSSAGPLMEESLPASDSTALPRLSASPRHGEWAVVRSGRNPATGADDSTLVWVVYPQRSDKAPVVVVVHEIFGLTAWVRAVVDQLAADGFIAIAPDLITMKNVPGDLIDGPDPARANPVVRALSDEELNRQLDAVARYGMSLPSATQTYGIVGYCWGGTAGFKHAIHSSSLAAAVVYYGGTPDESLTTIAAPVLGLYGGDDNRVNATIPRADSAMRALGKNFEYHIFEGAGHGFLRQQATAANARAAREAWPLTIQFLKSHLESR